MEGAQTSELLLKRELLHQERLHVSLCSKKYTFFVQDHCDLGMFATQLVQLVVTSTILKTGTAASSHYISRAEHRALHGVDAQSVFL